MYSATTASRRRRAAWIAAIVLSLAGCGGSSSTQTTAPTSLARCGVSLAATPSTVGADGGSGTIALTVDRECAWEARSGVEWLALTSPTSGQGSATLSYTVAANTAARDRQAVVTVNDGRLDVRQAAAACRYELSGGGRTFPAAGGSDRIQVATLDGCTWTAQTAAPWVAIDGVPGGTGPGTVAVMVVPNAGPARSAVVTVAGQSWLAAQDAAPPLPPPGPGPTPAPAPAPAPPPAPAPGPTPPAPAPGPTPSPAPAPAPAPVPSPAEPTPPPTPTPAPGPTPAPAPGPAPTPTPPPPAPAPAPAPGPGPGPGPGPAPTPPPPAPAPDPAPTCTFEVDPRLVLADADGDQEVIRVRASAANCAWTTSSPEPWLTFDARGGTGSGEVTLRVAPHDATLPRTGQVTVAGAPIAVTQEGAPRDTLELEGAVSELGGTCPALTFKVGGRLIRTSALTTFNGGPCRTITAGSVVEVRGSPQVDGSLLASRVRIRR